MLWADQLGAVDRLLAGEVPEPVLAGLEATYHGVASSGGMFGGVLTGRRVATANVPTPRAATQVKPPTVGSQALHAAAAARRHAGIDAVILRHASRLRCSVKTRCANVYPGQA